MTSDSAPTDGRKARRERSRNAVIEAAFALIHDGKVPPTADQVAERSGVSVSSVFRMFDGLDDMRSHAIEQFHVKYGHLLVNDFDERADRAERAARFVRSRVDLYGAAGPLMRLARQRALEHDRIAESVDGQRVMLATQAQRCWRPEARDLSPAEAANLVALIDATTSPEAFDVLGAAHARTPRQIERTWRRSVLAALAEWCEPSDLGDEVRS